MDAKEAAEQLATVLTRLSQEGMEILLSEYNMWVCHERDTFVVEPGRIPGDPWKIVDNRPRPI